MSTIQHSHLEDADAAHTRMRFSAVSHLAKQEALLRRVLMAEVQTLEMICREHLATVLLISRLKQVNLFGEILQQSIEAWAKEVQRLDLSYHKKLAQYLLALCKSVFFGPRPFQNLNFRTLQSHHLQILCGACEMTQGCTTIFVV